MSMYMRTQASTGFTDQSFRPLKETQTPVLFTGMKTDLILYKMNSGYTYVALPSGLAYKYFPKC
jgi:hypothetical protein